jgi:hypothetical protein
MSSIRDQKIEQEFNVVINAVCTLEDDGANKTIKVLKVKNPEEMLFTVNSKGLSINQKTKDEFTQDFATYINTDTIQIGGSKKNTRRVRRKNTKV